MSAQSYRMVWLFVFVLQWLFSSLTSENYQMCTDLGKGDRDMLVIGMLSTRLVVISTKLNGQKFDYYLHDLSPKVLNGTQLKIDVEGAEVKDKWPALYLMFETYLFSPNGVITLSDSSSEYIYVQLPKKGTVYDIGQKSVLEFKGVEKIFNDSARWISSSDDMTFFVITTDPVKITTMCQYKFEYQADKYHIKQVSPQYLMCTEDEKVIKLVESVNDCEHGLYWTSKTIANGLADSERFYLFKNNKVVLIFDRSVISTKQGQLVNITSMPLDKFINCPNSPTPAPVTNTSLSTNSNGQVTSSNNGAASSNQQPPSDHTPWDNGPSSPENSSKSSSSLIMIILLVIVIFVVPAIVAIAAVFCCNVCGEANNKQTNKANNAAAALPTATNKAAKKNPPKAAASSSKQIKQNKGRSKSVNKATSNKKTKQANNNKRKQTTSASTSKARKNTQTSSSRKR